jgi:hypothetical protein
MFPDQSFDRPQLAIAKPVILRQLDGGLKPKLGLPVSAVNVDVHSRLFPGKEEEPEAILTEDRWAHGITIRPSRIWSRRDGCARSACAIIPIPQ